MTCRSRRGNTLSNDSSTRENYHVLEKLQLISVKIFVSVLRGFAVLIRKGHAAHCIASVHDISQQAGSAGASSG
jgi:hypothetical protein